MTYIDGDISEPHWTLAELIAELRRDNPDWPRPVGADAPTGAQPVVDTLVDTHVHRLILARPPRVIRRLLRVGGGR